VGKPKRDNTGTDARDGSTPQVARLSRYRARRAIRERRRLLALGLPSTLLDALPPDDRMLGPAPVLDEPMIERIAAAVRIGTTLKSAAAYNGINERTLTRWMRWGRRASERAPLCARLVDAVDAANGAFEAGAIAQIQRASQESWTAAAWLLERRLPNQYGRSVRVESVTATADDPRIVALHEAGFEGDPELLTEDELETLIALLHKAIPRPPDDDVIDAVPLAIEPTTTNGEPPTNGETAGS
jgi:hypothetical protein